MEITWLGQAGFYLKINDTCVMIDPYLTNSIGEKNPLKNRKVKENKSFYSKKVDVLVISHCHIDHLDMPSINIIEQNNKEMTILSPSSCWKDLRSFEKVNSVLFDVGTEWTVNGITFKAIKAIHSDNFAVGLLVSFKNYRLYFTGDTLFNESVFNGIKGEKIDCLFLPINGRGNNMNMEDARRFAKKVKAKRVFPMHYGMFDDINPEKFICKNRVIMKEYIRIDLNK